MDKTVVIYDETYLWKLVEGVGRLPALVWDPPDGTGVDCSVGRIGGEDWYCYYYPPRPHWWRSSALGPDDLGKLGAVTGAEQRIQRGPS